MYFRCYGYFTFENEAEAKKNYELLTTREDNCYSYLLTELKLIERTIEFHTFGNFLPYITCENTVSVISEVAGNTQFGNVKIDEGDGENALWSWRSYSVDNKQVYQTHLDPQKSYQFKGTLEFADEMRAQELCQLLLTDSKNSIFTNFPIAQKVFNDDKRIIRFEGNFLHIDVHCAGNAAIFKKTQRLLQTIKTYSIGGNIESSETFALRFVPDKSDSSFEWVNDMNRQIFYRYVGYLTFQTTEEAHNACTKLLNNAQSVFSINAKHSFPLSVVDTKLIFDDIGNCHRTKFNETNTFIEDIALNAQKGKVETVFSNQETMDYYLNHPIVPSKVRKSRKTSLSIAAKNVKRTGQPKEDI